MRAAAREALERLVGEETHAAEGEPLEAASHRLQGQQRGGGQLRAVLDREAAERAAVGADGGERLGGELRGPAQVECVQPAASRAEEAVDRAVGDAVAAGEAEGVQRGEGLEAEQRRVGEAAAAVVELDEAEARGGRDEAVEGFEQRAFGHLVEIGEYKLAHTCIGSEQRQHLLSELTPRTDLRGEGVHDARRQHAEVADVLDVLDQEADCQLLQRRDSSRARRTRRGDVSGRRPLTQRLHGPASGYRSLAFSLCLLPLAD
mmetsp:Transcript_18920/g.47252  ORF Transcript_18920/g.47252 Transcript_18920/m.47252 type:complete len:261 (+) Transcript_18920:1006-1788(+)